MKRIAPLFASIVTLVIAASPAPGLSVTANFSPALLCAIDASKPRSPARALRGVDYVISKFDAGIVKAFGKAWLKSGDGTTPQEAVVLILRMADGTYGGRVLGSTNEQYQFTFNWHPSTVAVVHTHPNKLDPRPYGQDLMIADKYRVPVFTITNRGMYVYDPDTRKISRVLANTDWLDLSRFNALGTHLGAQASLPAGAQE